MTPPLSARDVFELLGRLGEAVEHVVLIGGQAVNVWVEHYLAQGRVPELAAEGLFLSKDIDFCARRDTVTAIARLLPRGRARFPTLDDATPYVGVVVFVDDAGHERAIDFLDAPFGMDRRAVERARSNGDLRSRRQRDRPTVPHDSPGRLPGEPCAQRGGPCLRLRHARTGADSSERR